MKLKKAVVSVLLLTLLLSVFLSLGVTAMADNAEQEGSTLAYTVEGETVQEPERDNLAVWLVAGCTVLLAVSGVVSVNCQKIYDSEK